MVISRVAIIVIIEGTITGETVIAFSIQATIPITGTKDPDLVSRFCSTDWRMPAGFRETNSGDANNVRET